MVTGRSAEQRLDRRVHRRHADQHRVAAGRSRPRPLGHDALLPASAPTSADEGRVAGAQVLGAVVEHRRLPTRRCAIRPPTERPLSNTRTVMPASASARAQAAPAMPAPMTATGRSRWPHASVQQRHVAHGDTPGQPLDVEPLAAGEHEVLRQRQDRLLRRRAPARPGAPGAVAATAAAASACSRSATLGAASVISTAARAMVDDLVELLDALRGEAQIVAVDPGVDLEVERGRAVEQVARLAHQLAEGRDLELRGVVGDDQPDEARALGDPLLLAGDHAGDPEPAALAGHLPQPVAGHHAQPLQRVAVAVERMGRQVQAQHVELHLQPLQRRPVLDRPARAACGTCAAPLPPNRLT